MIIPVVPTGEAAVETGIRIAPEPRRSERKTEEKIIVEMAIVEMAIVEMAVMEMAIMEMAIMPVMPSAVVIPIGRAAPSPRGAGRDGREGT
jgi:hypothetical protein